MLGQLGLAQELFGQTLLPIGTLYDPFIRRGLDAMFYSLYSGAKFMVVGTPSGVTLASEGGIHQSVLTSSIGTEFPELVFYEPCFAQELEWIMLDGLRRIQQRHSSTYVRLTTKRVDQSQFPELTDARHRERLRRGVLAGAYRLRDCRQDQEYQRGASVVHLFASGAMVPEALAAIEPLRQHGVFVNIFNVTGPGPLFTQYQRASMQESISGWNLFDELIPVAERWSPAVTVCDAHPHSLAWIGSALGTRVWPLGVTQFGQSGTLEEVYRQHRIDTASIVDACLAAAKSVGKNEIQEMETR
jgi:pyruvate dehydrogenase E1 component